MEIIYNCNKVLRRKMDRKIVGQRWDDTAANMLRAKGYKILKSNYRCRHGEIDIIAEKYGNMSFIEVKTRQSFQFGRPCEVIDDEKKSHIRKSAMCYLCEMREKGYVPRKYDFQVVEITILHTEHAF